MAALIEQPPEVLKTPDDKIQKSEEGELNLKIGEVIQIKEAKLNEHGVIEITNQTAENATESIEKDVIRHDTDPRIGKYKQKTPEPKPEQEVASRPVTGVSIRSHKRNTESPTKSIPSVREEDTLGKERVKSSGLSITVGRKPLHNTPASRNFSDIPFRGPFPILSPPGRGTLDQFPLPKASDKNIRNRQSQGRLVRLATVSLSARSKPSTRGQIASLYYEEPGHQKKIIGWDEANNNRPPLRIDMEGPGPWSYSPRNKPLYETNSPSWTFGSKTQPDKDGGARTSWEKAWFQTSNVWQQKVDFYSETIWPAPSSYKQKPLLGPKQRTFTEAPSFSIGVRKDFLIGKPGAEKEPSSADYESMNADKQLFPRGPAFSHQFRREGTVLWGNAEKTPGPGAYTPRVQTSKPTGPKFSIRSMRREKSHVLGPFATF